MAASVEHLKASFFDEERTRLRLPARVPREIPIPAGAVTTGFTEDVIKVELFKLLPECRQLGVQYPHLDAPLRQLAEQLDHGLEPLGAHLDHHRLHNEHVLSI